LPAVDDFAGEDGRTRLAGRGLGMGGEQRRPPVRMSGSAQRRPIANLAGSRKSLAVECFVFRADSNGVI